LKIAINTRFLIHNQLEGIGWYTYEVAKNLALMNPDDEFVFLFDRPFSKEFIFSDNVKGIHVPPPARHPILFKLWLDYSLKFVLDRFQPDIFLSPDNFCSLSYKGKTALVVHDLAYLHFPDQIPSVHLKYYQRYMPKFLKRADVIIAISEATKVDILRLLPKAESKIQVVHNGVRNDFRPLSIAEQQSVKLHFSQGKDYFLFIGALHPRKNIGRIIQAFNIFKQSYKTDQKLILCGRFAWHYDAIQKLIDASAFNNDIIHLNHVGSEEILRLTGGATALLYPSLFEGFGLPILEGFRSGVPVITSNLSSMPEVAGDAALLVDPFSVQAIASSMKTIHDDKNISKQLIAKGLERASQFNWETTARSIYEILKNEVSK